INAYNDWVCVTSDDGYSFLVRRKVANMSETMRDMLDISGNYSEVVTRICPVQQRAVIVEKMLEYMSFKSCYENEPTDQVHAQEFMDRIQPETVVDL
ncbi:hypothetical protein B0H13DRAFT_1601350, partial [Mycena leptocephala]